jgi:hypothetical protein
MATNGRFPIFGAKRGQIFNHSADLMSHTRLLVRFVSVLAIL